MMIPEATKHFVLGFIFDNEGNVVLIRKNKPVEMKGRLNGIGGKVEVQDIIAANAMRREATEEVETNTPLEWKYVGYFVTDMLNDIAQVDVFVSIHNGDVVSIEDEEGAWFPVKELPGESMYNLL